MNHGTQVAGVLLAACCIAGFAVIWSSDSDPIERDPPNDAPKSEAKSTSDPVVPIRSEVQVSPKPASEKNPTEDLRPLTAQQENLVKRLARVSSKASLHDLRGLVGSDEHFGESIRRALDEADKAVNDAMTEKEELRYKILYKMIAENRHEVLPINERYDDPKRGEIIASMCTTDPTGKQVRKLVRIYPGQEPKLDMARAALKEGIRHRKELVERLVAERLKR
jgi:hypothetical protein